MAKASKHADSPGPALSRSGAVTRPPGGPAAASERLRGPREAVRPRVERHVVRTPVALPGEAPPRESRRFVTTLCFLLIVVAMLLFAKYANPGAHATPTPVPVPAARRVPTWVATAPPPAYGKITKKAPLIGTSGQFTYALGRGPVLGTAGKIRHFAVALESPARPGAADDFAEAIDRTLGDRRSWIASGEFRLQRVPPGAHAEFTVFLASAGTSRRMCAKAGLETGGYTSCRVVGEVVINVERWEHAVPGYQAPLGVYRQYAINHEVGHQLGHGHERCPGNGEPAPVMQQQTLGLKGCKPNAWPYLNGKRWTGPPTR